MSKITNSGSSAVPVDMSSDIEAMREALATQAAALPEDDRIAVAAQVFQAIVDHAREGGSFRYLIYDRLGFSPAAYLPLYDAGGMHISDNFVLTDDVEATPEILQDFESLAKAAPMAAHPTLKRADGTPVPWPTPERSQLFTALGFMQTLLESNRALLESNRRLSQQCEEQAKLLENRPADMPQKG